MSEAEIHNNSQQSQQTERIVQIFVVEPHGARAHTRDQHSVPPPLHANNKPYGTATHKFMWRMAHTLFIYIDADWVIVNTMMITINTYAYETK